MIYNFYVNINEQEQIAFIEKFVLFCQTNNIWYSIDLNTLLSVYRSRTLFSYYPFEVMMTFLSYQRLKRLAPNNVIDSFIDPKFKTLTAAFVPNNEKWKNPDFFIQIRLFLPTTIKKIKQFNNPLYYGLERIRRIEPNIKNAFNFLYASKNEGFIWLDNRFKKINHNWSPIVDFTTVLLPFAHFKVAALKDGLFILEQWFGRDWKSTAKIPKKSFYLSPLYKVNIKQKGDNER